jgi:ABC-type multidrug transport system permease subunit
LFFLGIQVQRRLKIYLEDTGASSSKVLVFIAIQMILVGVFVIFIASLCGGLFEVGTVDLIV